MSQCRSLCADDINFFRRKSFAREIQSDWRNAHNPTASLAVVRWVSYGAVPSLLQRGQTGISRCPEAEHFRQVHQPRVVKFFRQRVPFSLGPIPVPVAVGDVTFIVAHDTARHSSCCPDEEPRSGEQRHLGIIGYFRHAVTELIFGDALFPVLLEDGRCRHKFHCVTQRIPHSPANEATLEFTQITHQSSPP